MKIEELNANELHELSLLLSKLYEVGSFLSSCGLNECDDVAEAYGKLVDVQLLLMGKFAELKLKKNNCDFKAYCDEIRNKRV